MEGGRGGTLVAVLGDAGCRANARGDLRSALAHPARRLRRRLLGIPHPRGMVAPTSTRLRGYLPDNDSAVVGQSRRRERLLRPGVRLGRYRRGALATAVGGGYLMRGDSL